MCNVLRKDLNLYEVTQTFRELLTLVTQVPEVGSKLGLWGWVLLNLTSGRNHKCQGFSHFRCISPQVDGCGLETEGNLSLLCWPMICEFAGA